MIMASEENMQPSPRLSCATMIDKLGIDEIPTGELMATANQIAILNNMIPRGFKFEVADSLHKTNKLMNKSGKRKKHVRMFGVIHRLLKRQKKMLNWRTKKR